MRAKSLTHKELFDFSYKALLTVGTVSDFKWFLPRLLELCATKRSAARDLWLILGKLPLAEWSLWPETERAAVLEFLDCLWLDVLQTEVRDAFLSAQEFLVAFAEFESDLERWLGLWLSVDEVGARSHLADFIGEVVPCYWKHGGNGDGFLSKHPAAWLQILDWLANDETQIYLDAALLMPGATDEMADAIMILTAWREHYLRLRHRTQTSRSHP